MCQLVFQYHRVIRSLTIYSNCISLLLLEDCVGVSIIKHVSDSRIWPAVPSVPSKMCHTQPPSVCSTNAIDHMLLDLSEAERSV